MSTLYMIIKMGLESSTITKGGVISAGITATTATSVATTTSVAATATIATTTTSEATSRSAHLFKLRIDFLFSFSENDQEVFGLLGVVVSKERNGGTLSTRTTGSTNTMDIVLAVVGVVKVDHKVDTLDI
jgi:hypothetical protein